ncbi:hypothetical protein Tco_1055343 [Tanacetum coccineum]|uniref:Uncharacterized protein n=1 Tax=Tanacetum coccineum TaxID=301880 RepID=A0ABQ5GZC8_9ASTR
MSNKKDEINKKNEAYRSKVEWTPDLVDYVYYKYGNVLVTDEILDDLCNFTMMKVSKITSSCEIFSGPHDTQYCIEDPEQAFVEYASSRIDEAGDARLSKFEADFKQQQSEMTNKIDTVLKAITNRMAGALPSDTVKNPKLNVNSTSLVLKFFKENEKKIFSEAGDGVRIHPDGVIFDEKKLGSS